MIFDKLEKLNWYLPHKYSVAICEFIQQAKDNLPDGYYEIENQHIFAKMMKYETKDLGACKAESHEKYIDIQITLRGAEGISIFENNEKLICSQYNEADDVCFYDVEKIQPSASVKNSEGDFCILFPSEIHRPQELVGEKEIVKKLVIKMEAVLWQK